MTEKKLPEQSDEDMKEMQAFIDTVDAEDNDKLLSKEEIVSKIASSLPDVEQLVKEELQEHNGQTVYNSYQSVLHQLQFILNWVERGCPYDAMLEKVNLGLLASRSNFREDIAELCYDVGYFVQSYLKNHKH